MQKLLLITFVLLSVGCGFKPKPEFSTAHLNSDLSHCKELYITDRYSLSTNRDISAKQVYKIENLLLKNKEHMLINSYPLYHSFINSDKIVSNILINKNIRKKACNDNYLNNIKYLD